MSYSSQSEDMSTQIESPCCIYSNPNSKYNKIQRIILLSFTTNNNDEKVISCFLSKGHLDENISEIKIGNLVNIRYLNRIINSIYKTNQFFSNIEFSLTLNTNDNIIPSFYNELVIKKMLALTICVNSCFYVIMPQILEKYLLYQPTILSKYQEDVFIFIKLNDYEICQSLFESAEHLDNMYCKENVIKDSFDDKYTLLQKEYNELQKHILLKKEEFLSQFKVLDSTNKEIEDEIKEKKEILILLMNQHNKINKKFKQCSINEMKSSLSFEILSQKTQEHKENEEVNSIRGCQSFMDSVDLDEFKGLFNIDMNENNWNNNKSDMYEKIILCSECKEKERNVLFCKCNHCLLCFNCLEKVNNKGPNYECPICHTYSKIQKIIYNKY